MIQSFLCNYFKNELKIHHSLSVVVSPDIFKADSDILDVKKKITSRNSHTRFFMGSTEILWIRK